MKKTILLSILLQVFSFFGVAGTQVWAQNSSESVTNMNPDKKNKRDTSGTTTKINLGRMVVTDKKRMTDAFDASRSFNIVDKSKLDRKISFGMASVFGEEPGLSVSTTGPNSIRPMIRGLYDDRIGILLNGMRISEQRGGGNHLLSFDPAQVERVEVLRGPASVLYGSDAIGGIINFIPVQADLSKKDSFRISGENTTSYESALSGWKNSTLLRGGKGRLNFMGQFIYKKTENLQTPDGELGNSFYEGFKTAASLRYALDDGHISAYWYFTKGNIGIPNWNGARSMDFTKSFFDDEKHNMAMVNFEKNNISALVRTLKADFSWQKHNRHMNILNPAATNMNVHAEIFVNIDTLQFNPQVTLQPAKNHIINAGIGFFHESADSDRIFQQEFDNGTTNFTPFSGVGVIPDATRTGIGVYVQDEWSIGGSSRFVITPSVRWDLINAATGEETGHPVTDVSKTDSAFSANLGLLCKLSGTVNLALNAGRAFRAPTLLERFFFGPHQSAEDRGNPDLKPEKSLNFDLSVRYRARTLRASASVFYNRVADYIVSQNTGTTNTLGQDIYSWDNVSDAALYGGEASVEWQPAGGFTLFAAGSLVLGKDLDTDDNLPAVPPLRLSYGMRWKGTLFAGILLRAELQAKTIFDQNNPAPSESVTEGVTLLDASLGVIINRNLGIRFRMENITDQSWHDHLSRIGWIKEQKGRSFKTAVSLKF